jgi:hypothetical protein
MRPTSTLFALGIALGACTPGSVGGGGGGDDVDPLPGTALCEAQLTLTGTMTPPGTPPTMDLGCVPQGTWTVEVTVASLGDCDAAPVPTEYTYSVEGTGHNETITLTNNTTQETQSLQINDPGDGTCMGSFTHIWPSDDGGYHYVTLRPDAQSWDGTISGTGTYQLWMDHP